MLYCVALFLQASAFRKDETEPLEEDGNENPVHLCTNCFAYLDSARLPLLSVLRPVQLTLEHRLIEAEQ